MGYNFTIGINVQLSLAPATQEFIAALLMSRQEKECKCQQAPAEKVREVEESLKAEEPEDKTVKSVEAEEQAVKAEPAEQETKAEPMTEDEKAEIRKLASDFIRADKGNRDKLKKWLDSKGFNRVSAVTRDRLEELKEVLKIA